VKVGPTPGADSVRRDWPIKREPLRVRLAFGLLCGTALGWSIGAVATLDADSRDWAVLGLLAALAVAYEGLARRVGRLPVTADTRCDMRPVWVIAAAAALPGGLLPILVVVVSGQRWPLEQRPAGVSRYRAGASGCVVLVAALAANAVGDATGSAWDDTSWMLADALSVLVVLATYAAIDRGLMIGGRLVVGLRGRQLLGTRDDNWNDLAAACLGGLVALSALRAPWLAVLVLPPMVLLRRGAMIHELETAATVDAKTGLLNAPAWEEISRRELARGKRNGHPVGILILDIDRFKSINDRFGHLVGDQVLRQIGGNLNASVREFDSVGRFGGEEFVVVLPEASAMESLVVAERLRLRIAEMRVPAMAGGTSDSPDVPMSVSIGVACAPADGEELTALLLAADAALYEAKGRGRNCVVLATGRGGEHAERRAHG
jgi:diguanylate cyclase (GGDEF)-like protein